VLCTYFSLMILKFLAVVYSYLERIFPRIIKYGVS
jgi:hypothetical protein